MSDLTPHRSPLVPQTQSASPSSSVRMVLWLALASSVTAGCYSGPEDPLGDTALGGGGENESDGDEKGDDPANDDGANDSAGGDGPGDDDGGADDGGADDGGPGDDGPGDDGPGDDGPGDDGGADDGGPGDDGPGDDGPGDDGPGDDGGDPPPADVPDTPYCDEVGGWDPAWAQLEQDILDLVNQRRAEGANCGSEGSFGAAPPLSMNANLRCAARKHSMDMHERSFFDHTNPSGESPWDRMGQAGYNYTAAGENIAGGSPDAAGTMDQWMNSDGHCSNIMNPNFEEIGVGYFPGGQWGTLWTQVFGTQ